MKEYKFLDNDWIKNKKRDLENSTNLHFFEDSFFQALDLEIEFFIQNSDYTNKIKNQINTRYSSSTTNNDLIFYGDIAIHNYEFLFDLHIILWEHYNEEFEDFSDISNSFVILKEKVGQLEKDFDQYFKEPDLPKPSIIKSIDSTIDLSDTSAVQKVLYLHKLGIIDFLRNNNNASINALASILSAITGEKLETLQSYLNPIISPTAGQKNNPFNSVKNIQKVEKQLINAGFNFKETI